ncbi:hypothetical protein [Neobacillus sp. PS2-9]|uniref:hypothetical protein n=1 Tax=Neobacillus sp. PS2-9 TaxID=3070676 RepID=UPI0027DF0D76|nr:hypothetical protein [Neobacillus sp. PS2-9]WML56027.1 hypothetical protein RCG25_13845 [Neobacillus sp. PS2-9]
MTTILNKELQARLDQLEEPNKSLLEKLLIDIDQINQKDEVRATLRNRIRESVTMEMRK